MRNAGDRLTLGVLVGSLIIATALLARADVPAPFRVFGYAGPGAVLFLLAAGAGVLLMARMLREERWDKSGPHSLPPR